MSPTEMKAPVQEASRLTPASMPDLEHESNVLHGKVPVAPLDTGQPQSPKCWRRKYDAEFQAGVDVHKRLALRGSGNGR